MNTNEKKSIELLLEQFKHFNSDITFSKREKVVRCLARQNAVKAGKTLNQEEMHELVNSLFSCNNANVATSGSSPTFIHYKENYLDGLFGIK